MHCLELLRESTALIILLDYTLYSTRSQWLLLLVAGLIEAVKRSATAIFVSAD